MEKALVLMDKQRRIYVPKGVEGIDKAKGFFLVKFIDRWELIPIPKDPIKDLEELGRKLPKKSLKTFRKEIEKGLEKEALRGLR